MDIRPTAISQALRMLADTDRPMSVGELSSPVKEEADRPAARRSSFLGSGLDLELTLKSGQRINLDIRVNQAGGVSQLQLSSNRELSDNDQRRLQSFLSDLSESVNQLFRNDKAGVGLFDFANQSGIAEVEFDLYQDDGRKKQTLQFDKQGAGLNKKVEAQLYIYDRIADIEDEHSMTLSSEQQDKHQFSGSLNYQWLYRQVDQAVSVVEDDKTKQLMSGFFKSGLRALFESSNKGSALLQELGVSVADARRFISDGVKTLVADGRVNGHYNNGLPEQKQLNGLASFNAQFSSQRYQKGVAMTDREFSFNMSMSQRNFVAYDPELGTRQDVQNRRLRVEYESTQRQAVMEYLWTRDESVRTVYKDSSLSSSHYRVDDTRDVKVVGIEPQTIGADDSNAYSNRDDRYF